MSMFTDLEEKSDESRENGERRKLRNENLDLILKSSEILLEDFIELEVQYIGKLKEISHFNDIKNKKTLLKLLEDAQDEHVLPKYLNAKNDSILRINAFIVEILTRDNETMIAAFPLHTIATVCYAKKGNSSHIIGIQHGDPYAFDNNEFFNLYLFSVNNKNEAETICNVFKQSFHLLHIERTMSLLDQAISYDTISNLSASVSVAEERNQLFDRTPQLYRRKVQNDNTMQNTTLNDTINETITEEYEDKRETVSTPRNTAHETINSFIAALQMELNKSEFANFATAISEWQKGKPFEEFCREAYKICGKNRKHLIIDMKPFVPVKNIVWYENFIQEKINKNRFPSSESISSSSSSPRSTHSSKTILDSVN